MEETSLRKECTEQEIGVKLMDEAEELRAGEECVAII